MNLLHSRNVSTSAIPTIEVLALGSGMVVLVKLGIGRALDNLFNLFSSLTEWIQVSHHVGELLRNLLRSLTEWIQVSHHVVDIGVSGRKALEELRRSFLTSNIGCMATMMVILVEV